MSATNDWEARFERAGMRPVQGLWARGEDGRGEACGCLVGLYLVEKLGWEATLLSTAPAQMLSGRFRGWEGLGRLLSLDRDYLHGLSDGWEGYQLTRYDEYPSEYRAGFAIGVKARKALRPMVAT
mgnify:CR=1 FL=1